MGSRVSGMGRNELSGEKVSRVETLLRESRPKAEIARVLQISLQSVIRIAGGKHVAQRKRQALVRCGCGGLVMMPCRACAARDFIRAAEAAVA